MQCGGSGAWTLKWALLVFLALSLGAVPLRREKLTSPTACPFEGRAGQQRTVNGTSGAHATCLEGHHALLMLAGSSSGRPSRKGGSWTQACSVLSWCPPKQEFVGTKSGLAREAWAPIAAGTKSIPACKVVLTNSIVVLCGMSCPELLKPDMHIITDGTEGGSGSRTYLLVQDGELASIVAHVRRQGPAGVTGCCVLVAVACLAAGCLIGWLFSQRATTLLSSWQLGQGGGQQAVAGCSERGLERTDDQGTGAGTSSSGGSSSRASWESSSSEASRLAPLVIRWSNSFEDAAALCRSLPDSPTPTTPHSSPTRALAARLFSHTPNPQWLDTVVSQSQIEFCRHGDGQLVRLGSGASGSVFKVVMHGHTIAACKVFDFSQDLSLPKHFVQEAALLRQINHPHVLQFYGVSATDSTGMLLMELMEKDLGSELHALVRSGERLYAWHARGHHTALQVACGLAYLHSRSIVHMDLKLSNVLLARDGTAKLADVGFSKLLRGKYVAEVESSRIGTWEWCAPEVLLGEQACEKADVFSFGVLLWALITGEDPRRGHMPPLDCPQACPSEVAALQAQCMERNPALRPSAAHIVETLRGLKLPARPAPSLPPHSGSLSPMPTPAQAHPAPPLPSTPSWAARHKRWPQLFTCSPPTTNLPSPPSCLHIPPSSATAALGIAEPPPLPSPFRAAAAATLGWEEHLYLSAPLSGPVQAFSQADQGSAGVPAGPAGEAAGTNGRLPAFGSVQWAASTGQPAMPTTPAAPAQASQCQLRSSHSAPALAGAMQQQQPFCHPAFGSGRGEAALPLPALSSPVEQPEVVYRSAIAYLADA